jgi:hypothetical protein
MGRSGWTGRSGWLSLVLCSLLAALGFVSSFGATPSAQQSDTHVGYSYDLASPTFGFSHSLLVEHAAVYAETDHPRRRPVTASRESSDVKRGFVVAAKSGDEFVDLASASRRRHILDGEVRPNGSFGGGHRPGTGFPNKSEFPAGWSDDRIMHAIFGRCDRPIPDLASGQQAGGLLRQRDSRRHRHRSPHPQQPDLDRIPHERPKECSMSPEEYLGAVKAVAWQAGEHLPAERLVDVHSLIDHGEPAEGLCSLAWAIVTERVRVPADLIDAIYEYTADLVDEEFMPPDLRDFEVSDQGG